MSEQTHSDQSNSGVEITIRRSIHVYLDLTDAGGTYDGIGICVNEGDTYALSLAGARAVISALEKAVAEREERGS